MATLVYIYRCQNRFAEAIGTGKALCDQVSKVLKDTHPYTLRAKFQLAAAHLANGDYSEALRILEDMMTFSGNFLQPEILRYQLELSRAYFLVGKTRKAQQLALHVAIHQAQTDIPTTWTCEGPCTFRCDQCFAYNVPTEEALQGLAVRVKDLVIGRSSFSVHPYFATTLQHLATMVVRVPKEVSQAELGVVAGLIRNVRSLNNDGDHINNTGDARLDFALALLLKEKLAQEEDSLGSAATLFRSVMMWRNRELGGSHLETIRAYRELMIVYSMRALSNLTMDKPVDISLEEVEYRSLAILGSIESTLGLYHPETLQSRLWYFTVTLLTSSHQRCGSDEEKVAKTSQEIYREAETILTRARAPSVREERYIEALKIEKTVFDLLLGADLVQEDLGQFLQHSQNDIAGTIETNSDEDISLELKQLQGTFRELWHSFQVVYGG
ncbi:hypothetical protein PG985_003582 [Apiospora marii]|uniref:uncharacterized protein n=1 Tax=Apiospora marii TaxID=335849 RepID=UPI00312E453F